MGEPFPETQTALRRNSPLLWAAAVAVVGLVERGILYLVYAPVPYGDTPAYLRLAQVLAGGTLDGYDGTRVPGYPALLALLSGDPERVWLAQMALGLGLSLTLFWFTWQTTRSAPLAAAIALLYNAIPGQFLFEANLLTESLTAFFVFLALALLAAADGAHSTGAGVALAGLTGVTASLAGMVRPLFFLLPVWLFGFIATSKGLRGARWAGLAVFCLGPVLILGSWLGYVHSHYGVWSPTVMGGYHLVQHTGEYFEHLPDDEAAIRDTYLKYRDAQIEARGSQVNAIWEAIPELTQVSGLNFYSLSRRLQELSLGLILAHPGLYLRNALEGWVDFWKAPVYWRAEALEVRGLERALTLLGLIGRLISVGANGLFLLIAALSTVSQRTRSRLQIDRYSLLTGGLVLITSLVQTLVDHGDNPRFLVPLQMAVIYVVVRSGWSLLRPGPGKEAA